MKFCLLTVLSFSIGLTVAQNNADRILHVKLQDGTAVYVRDGKLVSEFGKLPDLSQFGYWEPFYNIPSEQLQRYYLQAKQNLKKNLSDPNTIFEFHVKPGVTLESARKAIQENTYALNYVSIPPKLSTPAVPNLEPAQLYLFDQDPGMHVQEFWNAYSIYGAGVKVCDVEYIFNSDHADLPPVIIVGPQPEDPGYGPNHGTAVLGEIASLNDGIGTTGIAYQSQLYFSGAYINQTYYLEEALINTLSELDPGDVVLIEQQIGGPNQNQDYVPVEWYEPFYDAIQLISGNGLIVVEAAGNGNQNLDDPIFSMDNNGHYPFLQENWSEAIMVGAGAVGINDAPRSRLWFSNYGSRIDLQGNGEGVVTTGYGSAYGADGPNKFYSDDFGGTSGASPIVVGAVTLLQSLYRNFTGNTLTRDEIRDLLVSTGKPQVAGVLFPVTEKIGPLPNIFAAGNYLTDHLGIDAYNKNAFSVFPNPTNGSFSIYVPNEMVKEFNLRDLSGKEIEINEVKTDTGFEVENIHLQAGVYYLSVIYKDGTVVTKPVQVLD
ncbi:S8 family peptidase [Fluviicola chungangensis]|uniref:S8 family serine peptidase n=1 Tax=Fluviicola chungangensis TaxID=2597671 RepID=A0A556N2D3_9FLAO|nr:S8 family peptidase [Fluviicola chungangensis]TSJ46347.1 S8 family serine peptidase [Fluviicola chungangensis]